MLLVHKETQPSNVDDETIECDTPLVDEFELLREARATKIKEINENEDLDNEQKSLALERLDRPKRDRRANITVQIEGC